MTDNLCLCGAEKHACVVRHLAVTLSHRCVSGSGLNECKECYSVCRLKCSSFVVFFVAGKCVYFSFVGLNVFFLFLFLLRRKTEQFLHMQSKGSSYGPSARDGGLLDSMKTLKSPNWSLQFSEDPTSPSPPHPNLPNLTPFPSTQSYATPIAKKKNTSLSDSDTELNKTIMITRSTLTCPCPLRPENVSSASVFFVSFLLSQPCSQHRYMWISLFLPHLYYPLSFIHLFPKLVSLSNLSGRIRVRKRACVFVTVCDVPCDPSQCLKLHYIRLSILPSKPLIIVSLCVRKKMAELRHWFFPNILFKH